MPISAKQAAKDVKALRSDIAHIEARYDCHFPPQIHVALEKMRRELAWAEHQYREATGGQSVTT